MKYCAHVLLLWACLGTHWLGAQTQTEYLDEMGKTCHPDEAFKQRITTQTDSGWRMVEYLVRPKVLLLEAEGRGQYQREQSGFLNRQFYYNGFPKAVTNSQDGLLEGVQLRFFPNGMLQDSLFYRRGRLVGYQWGWYPDGSLRYEMQLDSTDLGQGICLGLFPNGNISFKGRLAPGFRKTSDWFYYREDGTRAAVYRYGTVPDTLHNLAPVLVQDKFEGIVCDTLNKPLTIYWFDAAGQQTNAPEQENRLARYGKKGSADWAYFLQKELVAIPRLMQAQKLMYESHFVVGSDGRTSQVVLDKKNLDDLDYGIKKVFEKAPDWEPAFHANRYLPMLMVQTLRLGFNF